MLTRPFISVVGQVPEEATEAAAAPSLYVRTQDPEWYAEQASKLRAELESREADLQHYRQAIEDVIRTQHFARKEEKPT